MKDLRDKVAFITGGASGLGLAMAKSFGREGMKVMIADIEEKALSKAVADLRDTQVRAEGVLCDVGERSSLQNAALKTVGTFGKVHVVCNNAGVAVGGEIGTIKERDWQWIIDVNLMSVVYGTETFLPLMASHGEGGHFVNTASMAGMIAPPGMEPYNATKFAVVALSEGWRLQLEPRNIGVSVLCPGFVQTRIHESQRAKPSRYGTQTDDPGLGSDKEQAAQLVMSGIPPDVVGARVVEGIKANELYIFTHPEFRPILEMRVQGIMAGFDVADRSPALSAVPKKDASEMLARMQEMQEQAKAAGAKK
jgi:NAD(P)-dependent dehydrogenase (short-subunit alcohol dehydrogenase family)